LIGCGYASGVAGFRSPEHTLSNSSPFTWMIQREMQSRLPPVAEFHDSLRGA
jgi:hypothetical protein